MNPTRIHHHIRKIVRIYGQRAQNRSLVRAAGEKIRTGNIKSSSRPENRGENTDGRNKTDLSSGQPRRPPRREGQNRPLVRTAGRNHGRETQNSLLIRKAGEKSRTRCIKPHSHPCNRGENPDRRQKTESSSGLLGRNHG